MNQAEVGHLRSDLIAAQLDDTRLRAALAGRADPLEDFNPPEAASPALIEMQRQFLRSQVAEHNAKLAEIDRQLSQKEAERANNNAPSQSPTVQARTGQEPITPIPAVPDGT